MNFIADAMLGTLAKWLRAMGFDTAYANDMTDDEILKMAIDEGRIIISRDRELCRRVANSMLIETTVLDAQLSQVIESYPVDPEKILSRCLECNSLLGAASKDESTGNVPEGVIERHNEFWKCPECMKFYWAGTHWQNMREKAERFIK